MVKMHHWNRRAENLRSTRLGRVGVAAAFVIVTGMAGLLLGMRFIGGGAALDTPLGSPSMALMAQPVYQAPMTPPQAPPPLPRRSDRRWHPGADGSPVLAVVIDDIGHNMRTIRSFLSLDITLTYSVLPGLKYSEQAAELITGSGLEYLIHLPMEPRGFPGVDPGPGPLLLAYSEQTTMDSMQRMMASLPGAIGASNHMGSAYTSNSEKMGLVLSQLAGRNLFFLDSRTYPSRVSGLLARKGRFPYVARDVFLDNDRDEDAIVRQLEQAIRIAKRRGRAVAIGHPYPQTRRVLARLLGQGRTIGVRVAPLSEFLR